MPIADFDVPICSLPIPIDALEPHSITSLIDALNEEVVARQFNDASLQSQISALVHIPHPPPFVYAPVYNTYSNLYDVTKFGAVGDGINDNTTAFMNAFAFASASNTSIYIPDGEYRLSAQLIADKIPAIIGASETRTILFWDNYASSRGIRWTSNNDRIGLRFSDMTLANKGAKTGTGLLVDTSGQILETTIVQREMSRAHVERVTFRGYSNIYTDGWGINADFRETLSCTVSRCTVIGVITNPAQEPISTHGFRFYGGAHPAGALVHLNAIHCCGIGVLFQGYEGAFVESNNIVSCGTGAEFFDTDGRPHFSVRGNHISSRQCGVKITNGSEAFITDNLIYAALNAPSNVQGVLITGENGELYTIRGNQFENSSRCGFAGATAIPFDGIHISGSGFANIGANIFRDVDIGTILWPGSHSCLLDDNNLYKTVRTTQFVDQGTSNTIRPQI